MTGTDDRLDEEWQQAIMNAEGDDNLDDLDRLGRSLIRQLRDARAEIETETQRLTTRMGRIEDTLRARLNDAHAEIVSWRNAYEGAVQRAEQAESDLRQAKAQHAIDESELVENTVKAHVQQMNVIGAELAAERAKVERVKALLYEPLNHDVLRRALTGDEQGE